MARRARQGIHPLHIALIAGALAVLAGGALFMLSRSKDSLRSVSELSVSDYVQKGDSMGGTVWRVTGSIDEKVRWTPDRGQLVSVAVDQGGCSASIPVLVPPEFNDVSINIGDRFTFKVEVGEKQLLIVRDLERS